MVEITSFEDIREISAFSLMSSTLFIDRYREASLRISVMTDFLTSAALSSLLFTLLYNALPIFNELPDDGI